MNNFLLLVKTNCQIFWGSLKTRKKGRYAASGGLMAVVLLFVGVSMSYQSIMQAQLFAEAGIPKIGIFMSLLSALTIGILFGLMRAANAPGSRDAEMLLSLPVKRLTVVGSKIVTQYIFDAPLMLLIFVPAVISYYVIGGGSIGALLRGLLLALLLPMIPIALAYLIGAVLAILQEKFKLTGIVTTSILMVMFIGYMFINIQSSSFLGSVTEGADPASAYTVIEKFAPLSWLTHFVLDGSLFPVIFSLLMLFVPFYLGVRLFASRFGRPKNGYHSSSKILSFVGRSPRRALLDKEIKRYLSCSIYVFNTAFGPLLLLVLTAAFVIAGPEAVISSMGLPMEEFGAVSNDLILVIMAAALCFFPAMTSTTASSISLEGKQLWILKAHPIPTEDIFWAKSMVNIILLVPACIVSVLCIGIRMRMSAAETLGLAAVLALFGVFISLLGLIVNLLFPRFDWDNETQVVKQSMSVMLAMLAGFITACIPFVLYFVLLQGFGFAGFLTAGILIFALLTSGAFVFLKTKGKRMFEAL